MNNDIMNVNAADESNDAVKIKRQPKKHEIIFAWVAVLLGYLFCRALPVSEHPLGGMFLIWAFFAMGEIFAALSDAGSMKNRRSLFYIVSPLFMSFSLFLSGNSTIHTLVFLFAMVCFVYRAYLNFGGALEDTANELLFYDFFKAVIVMPFASLSALFASLFPVRRKPTSDKSDKKEKSSGSLGWALLGLLVAVIPTLCVIALLSYDAAFNDIINRIADFSFGDLSEHIVCLIFAVPLAAYGFGAFMSGVLGKYQKHMSAEACKKFSKGAKFAPEVMVAFALLPLLSVYTLFFVSQSEYYLAAFTGVLPKGVEVYSTYAREGFFQLCTVSGINAAIMLTISAFAKNKHGDKPGIAKRVFVALLSVSTVILVATAISKMVLYIDVYGLTHLRVYTSWFMVLLGLAFVIMLIKQIFPGFKSVLVLVVAFVVLFGALALSDLDTFISKYNVDRYLDGTLDSTAVVSLIDENGDSAVPEMIRLCNELEARMKSGKAYGEYSSVIERCRTQLLRYKSRLAGNGEQSIFSQTLPRIKARAALDKYSAVN